MSRLDERTIHWETPSWLTCDVIHIGVTKVPPRSPNLETLLETLLCTSPSPPLPSPLPRGLVNYLCKWVSTSVVWVSIFEENIQSWVFHILIFFGNLHGYDSILFFTLVAVIGYRVLKLLKWMWFWAWLEFRVMILRKSTYIKKKINYIKIKAHILYTPKK